MLFKTNLEELKENGACIGLEFSEYFPSLELENVAFLKGFKSFELQHDTIVYNKAYFFMQTDIPTKPI